MLAAPSVAKAPHSACVLHQFLTTPYQSLDEWAQTSARGNVDCVWLIGQIGRKAQIAFAQVSCRADTRKLAEVAGEMRLIEVATHLRHLGPVDLIHALHLAKHFQEPA